MSQADEDDQEDEAGESRTEATNHIEYSHINMGLAQRGRGENGCQTKCHGNENPPRTPRAREVVGMIYFIQRITGGPIKIGTTVVLSKRLQSLRNQTRATLKVLGVMDGGKKEELDTHVRFHKARIAGEWFAPSDDLLMFIKNHTRDWNGVDEDSLNRNEYLTITTAARITKVNSQWLLGAITQMASMDQAEAPCQVGRSWIVRRVDALNAGRPEKHHVRYVP